MGGIPNPIPLESHRFVYIPTVRIKGKRNKKKEKEKVRDKNVENVN